MKIKKSILVILLLSICSLCGCETGNGSTVLIPPTTGTFEFAILKTGQADTMILKTQNHSVIIDCAEEDDGAEIVEYLANNNISNVDYIFITHFDKDHVGGFPEVIANITANNIVVPNYKGNNSEYEKYLSTVDEKGLKVMSLTEDMSFVLDDVLFEVSTPKKQDYAEGDNDFSLVISAAHGENTFLFAADAEKDRLPEVLSQFGHQYDFLKVPHHGKHNKNTKRFINTIKPQYAVICDSEKNPAEEETLALLKSAGSAIYRTKDGDISVFSDGKEIKIAQ